ncbi:hypothetical protein [Promicromonospora soli]|uniref:Uncharacterized protein n=1 Tax=Promicromonospora soli TaxID=2035533 RepID=A0A919G9D7_9MICO|nr:hypothetical protein [Promicromonospora soli]GHH80423.1 hypothetical protein GCM10017772_48480 [Promicromonospora soli]
MSTHDNTPGVAGASVPAPSAGELASARRHAAQSIALTRSRPWRNLNALAFFRGLYVLDRAIDEMRNQAARALVWEDMGAAVACSQVCSYLEASRERLWRRGLVAAVTALRGESG